MSWIRTSLRIPAAAFPSSLAASATRSSPGCCLDIRFSSTAASLGSPTVMRRVLCRSTRGSKAFGFHQCRLLAELDERGRGRFDQWLGATDENVRPFARRPGDRRQHHAVDPAAKSGPPLRGFARERECNLECLVVLRQSGELTTVY